MSEGWHWSNRLKFRSSMIQTGLTSSLGRLPINDSNVLSIAVECKGECCIFISSRNCKLPYILCLMDTASPAALETKPNTVVIIIQNCDIPANLDS